MISSAWTQYSSHISSLILTGAIRLLRSNGIYRGWFKVEISERYGEDVFLRFIYANAPVWRIIVLRKLSIAAITTLMLTSFGHSASGVSIGAGNPYPVSNYVCKDGTRLAVQLLGDRASVSVNDAIAVELSSMGAEGTTFSNGRLTLTIVQGRLSWGVGRAVPTACTGG
ncbi:hypothetical protein [Mesorhizobium sp. CAU 1732]|uniref:hypothetical protein n=1 Tax=Mesorhizobium sp. CAU 1732 TaxID=3140358 RepID=UPI003261CDBE